MPMKKPLQPESGYDTDFFQWTQTTADLLRRRRFDEIDAEHAAEEIEDMGKRDRREVRSRLIVLLMHLLKWQQQPAKRARSTWRATIGEQRTQLRLVVSDSPSLGRIAEQELPLIYPTAVKQAAAQTRLPVEAFPAECPFSVDQVLNEDFLPE